MTEQTPQAAEEVEAAAAERMKALLMEAGALGIKGLRKNASEETIKQAIQRKHDELHQAAAMKAAAERKRNEKPVEMVQARILKAGDGKISAGIHIPGRGDVYHERGTVLTLERSIALGLEARGYVELAENAEND